ISGKEERIGKKGFKGFEKNIKLEKVHLQFEEKIILENINFSVLKNQSVAFVGESGSGKTTLVNVICGLITPDKGHIYVDNESLEDLDKRSYQKKIGYITQDPVIFNDTLFNNVTLWAEPT